MAQLTDVTGVSETRAENLRDEGFTTVDDIAEADASDLEDVHGVGESTAYDLIDSAQEVITSEHSSDDGDESEEDDEEEVGLEDLEEVNEGDPEGYNERTESEPPEEAEEDEAEEEEGDEEPEVVEEDEPEEAEDEGDDTYTVKVDVPSDEHYDYFLKALVDARLERSSTNLEAQQAINSFIEAVRPLGGEGTVEAELTTFGLNTIHASVQQAESRHQQNRQNDAFEALRDMKEQVDDARAEYVF